jgi:predicted DNA-binding protein (UPF0251 family)
MSLGYRFKRRHGGRGRPPKIINVARHAATEGLTPLSKSARPLYTGSARTIYIDSAEVEAQRLVDLEGLSQEEAGRRMGISRGTVWRLLQTARKKTVQALVEGRALLIFDDGDKQDSEEVGQSSKA